MSAVGREDTPKINRSFGRFVVVAAVLLIGVGVALFFTERSTYRTTVRVGDSGGLLMSGYFVDSDRGVYDADDVPLEFSGQGDDPDDWISGPFWVGIRPEGGAPPRTFTAEYAGSWERGLLAVFALQARPGRAHELAWIAILPWPDFRVVATLHGRVNLEKRSIETYLLSGGETDFFLDFSVATSGDPVLAFRRDRGDRAESFENEGPLSGRSIDLSSGRVLVLAPDAKTGRHEVSEQLSIRDVPPGPAEVDAMSALQLVRQVLGEVEIGKIGRDSESANPPTSEPR